MPVFLRVAAVLGTYNSYNLELGTFRIVPVTISQIGLVTPAYFPLQITTCHSMSD